MPELGPQTYTGRGRVRRSAPPISMPRRAPKRSGAPSAPRPPPASRPATIFAAGYLEANARAIAVATSSGLFAYHRTTDADFSVTARTPDGTGSGWAHAGARDWSAVDPAAIGRVAAQKAVASRNPQAIAPGLYTAVLEPQAVNDLDSAAGRRAQRAQRRRRAKRVLEARRRHAHRREGGRRAGHALLGSRRRRPARSAVRRRRPAGPSNGLDREGHPEEPLLHAVLGPEAGEAADRLPARRRAGARRRDARAPRS